MSGYTQAGNAFTKRHHTSPSRRRQGYGAQGLRMAGQSFQ